MDINIGITPEARENSAEAVSRLMAVILRRALTPLWQSCLQFTKRMDALIGRRW